MSDQWWETDEDLVIALHDALQAYREVPDSFRAAGQAIYPTADLDAELAALIYDSITQPLELVRGGTDEEPASLRAMTYAGSRLTMHLEITNGAVHGQVVPPQRGEIQLQTETDKVTTVNSDDDGWFIIRPIPTKPFRLHCKTPTDNGIVTGWISL